MEDERSVGSVGMVKFGAIWSKFNDFTLNIIINNSEEALQKS
jgi:hypothetical protein